ncbi:NAD(P)/FAD-dependent oxidoreductase [Bosea sp. NPDC055594]
MNPSTSGRDVTIIGAGIVGTVCASYLLREGHRVTLIDRGDPGAQTSFGNTGGISPASVVPVATPGILRDVPKWLSDPEGPLHIKWSHLPKCLPWLLRFLRASGTERAKAISRALTALNMPTFDAYEPLLRDAGLLHLFHRTGQLTVYKSEEAFEHERFGIDLRRDTGVNVDILNADEIRQLEPALAPIFVKAHFIETHGHCKNPFGLVQGLAEHFVRNGGILLRDQVKGFEFGPHGPEAVITDSGRRPLDTVVVAAGMWSDGLTRQLGHKVPLESHRGYHVTLPDPRFAPRRMVLSADYKVAITPMEMGLRLAGTVELAGVDAPPDYRRAEKLLKVGAEVLPGLNAEGHTRWMGHRPCTPDSLPVLGSSPKFPNVYYAFGHGHQGLLGASQTGKVIAELIAGRPASMDLEPFRVDRF